MSMFHATYAYAAPPVEVQPWNITPVEPWVPLIPPSPCDPEGVKRYLEALERLLGRRGYPQDVEVVPEEKS